MKMKTVDVLPVYINTQFVQTGKNCCFIHFITTKYTEITYDFVIFSMFARLLSHQSTY